jgi:hypothetical protein
MSIIAASVISVGCSSLGTATAPTTPADETPAVCAEAVSQAKDSAATLEQSLLELASARATRDNEAHTAAANKIEDAALKWATSLAKHSDRTIRDVTKAAFDQWADELFKLADSARNQSGRIIPGATIDFVQRAAETITWACQKPSNSQP